MVSIPTADKHPAPDDWPAVRAIYAEGLATGTATFETTLPSQSEWDAAHLPICRLVARANDSAISPRRGLAGTVIGWAALSPISKRKAYAGVAEVSIYVARAARGQGVGKALLTALIEASESAGLWTLQAYTFASNTASQALHLSCGFRLVGRRERIAQLNGQWQDTVLMERRSTKI